MNLILSEVEETIHLVEGEEDLPAADRLNASLPSSHLSYFTPPDIRPL